jgi:hypothetical protein
MRFLCSTNADCLERANHVGRVDDSVEVFGADLPGVQGSLPQRASAAVGVVDDRQSMLMSLPLALGVILLTT